MAVKIFFSEKTIEKLRKINTGKKNPNYGKKHTKETIQKIKKANIGKVVSEEVRKKISKSKMGHSFSDETIEKFRYNASNGVVGMKGKKHSEETKLKISKKNKGRKLSEKNKENLKKISKIKIKCIENDTIYNSINDASKDLNINRDKISLCLSNRIESYNNLHFEYVNKEIKKIKKKCLNCGKEYFAQKNHSKCCTYKCTLQRSKRISRTRKKILNKKIYI